MPLAKIDNILLQLSIHWEALIICYYENCIKNNFIGLYIIGMLRLIGYRSLSADNRLGMFDRWSLKKADLCAVCKLLCNNCTIVKTKMQCMIKHLGEINIYIYI